VRRPRRSLTLVTGPASEPVTLAEAKAWARIDDDADDSVVTHLITAARMAAEEYLRRSLLSQSYRLTIDLTGDALGNFLGDGVYDLPVTALYGGMPRVIELPKGPVQSITSVTTYDLSDTSSIFSSSNYHVDAPGERLVLNYGTIWPSNLRPIAACDILYVTGYGTAATSVPAPIRQGILIHIASLYEQRGQCEDAMDLPPGAKQLYNQYRIMGDRLG
jgi:hypothetical protein